MKVGVFVGILLSLSFSLRAAMIVYTDQVVATGSIGTHNFTNALVTVTVVGDTANVQTAPSVYYNLGTATVTIAGVGTATFTNTFAAYNDLSNVPPKLGMGDFVLQNGSLVDTESAAFASYSLTSAIGPISGFMYFPGGVTVPTSMGNFTLTAITGNSTFTATTPAPSVPALSAWGIFLLALLLAAAALVLLRKSPRAAEPQT